MKVAQVLYAGSGGHGSVVFSLLNADKNNEWQSVLGFLGIEPLLPAYAEACKRRSLPFKYFSATAGKPWKTWPEITRWLRDCRPNAIVLHSVTALLPCLWNARWRGVPLVVVEHQANALKRLGEWVFSFLAMLLADKVVLLTPAYEQELKVRLGWFYRPNKVRVIPNGIDTEQYSAQSRPVNAGRLVRLGMAARFTLTKRQDVLVEMMAELRQRAPDINWQLSLAGDGENWARVEKLVQSSGIKDSISLPGQLDEPTLIEWYQSLDIYLHASEGETLSTSLLQAMATALPIVASDVPGIRNLIADKVTCGLLVEKQAPQSFAESVIQLVEDPVIRGALANAGRSLVTSSYSQEEMFAGYSKLVHDHS